MSTSYNCECELTKLAEKLECWASELRQAAHVLALLRREEIVKEIKEAKKWAKTWMEE